MDPGPPMTRNLLSKETSPYLLQHRDNPVHWRPWNADVLAAAKKENKPILLSVGYAACHWCHVMAHESFEDEATARLMNDLFINVKVDREERPDIDAIYQSALQMMGGHGGWPLTMFLTPEGLPFWGGTYFPATAQYGRPAFADLLKGIAQTFDNDNGKVMENARAFRDGLAKLSKPEGGGEPTMEKLDQAAAMVLRVIDPVHGGTEGAPKFPQPSLFQFLLNAHRRTGRRSDSTMFLDAVTLTLDHICQGGIYDHLGGGFARYSTDEVWLAPHFEKMLYDNAQLIELLTDAWQETGSPLYRVRVGETIDWVMREMRSSDGGPFGFASALDADSEGEEGRFYVWTEGQIDDVLGPGEAAFKDAYDVTAHGNWEGKTILNRSRGLALGADDTEAGFLKCRETLLAARGKRVRPQRDDKVLADWNGMMIAALAKAGAVFDEPAWVDSAEAVLRFVTANMVSDDKSGGRLKHSWCSGRLSHPAIVDDYANMARAALMLLGVTGNGDYLSQAEAWVHTANGHYWDNENHGYFLAADDTGDVIARSKTVFDSAVPSGNAVMAEVLARLYFLTGEERHREQARQLITAIAGKDPGNMAQQPTLLNAFELLQTGLQIVIIGDGDDAATQAFRRVVFDTGLAGRIVVQFAPGAGLPLGLPPGHPAHGKELVDGKPAVYVCRGPVCGLPKTDINALRKELKGL